MLSSITFFFSSLLHSIIYLHTYIYFVPDGFLSSASFKWVQIQRDEMWRDIATHAFTHWKGTVLKWKNFFLRWYQAIEINHNIALIKRCNCNIEQLRAILYSKWHGWKAKRIKRKKNEFTCAIFYCGIF